MHCGVQWRSQEFYSPYIKNRLFLFFSRLWLHLMLWNNPKTGEYSLIPLSLRLQFSPLHKCYHDNARQTGKSSRVKL